MRAICRCLLAALFLTTYGCCKAQERFNSIMIFGTFTTSSKLFPHANDLDENLRNQFFPLDNILSGGMDYRRTFGTLNAQFGISVEYLQKTETFGSPETNDGFVAIPIEFTGYFTVPVGSDRLHLYMGGGGGVYFGWRTFTYAGARAVMVEEHPGVGIHILSGIEYILSPTISLRGNLKFRDVQFNTVNQFHQTSVVSDSRVTWLDTQPFSSRISIDGMVLNIGVAFHF